jgi:hypothetical protein
MLQLHVTDERGTVTSYLASEFPLLIGRSSRAQLRLDSAGVWEEHARIDLAESSRFPDQQRYVIESLGQSLVSINGAISAAKELAIGDEMVIGAARLIVSLSSARQKRLAVHEWSVWTLLFLVVGCEAVLIFLAE